MLPIHYNKTIKTSKKTPSILVIYKTCYPQKFHQLEYNTFRCCLKAKDTGEQHMAYHDSPGYNRYYIAENFGNRKLNLADCCPNTFWWKDIRLVAL